MEQENMVDKISDSEIIAQETEEVINEVEASVEPVEVEDSKDEGDGFKDTDISNLQEKCPAFKEGCPFSKGDDVKDAEVNEEGNEKGKEECPFKDAKNITDIHAKITEIEHSPGGKEILGEMLGHIHTTSALLKDSVGECPVFQSKKGCPFKLMCSDGIPLLEKFSDLEWAHVFRESVNNTEEDAEDSKIAKKKSDIDLSQELKLGTKKVHRAAENVHFVREFMKGRVEQKIYIRFISSLYYVYKTLEAEGEKHKDHELFKRVYFPKELNRLDTLKEDLLYFYGNDWEDEIMMTPATQEYVDRIEEISKTDPTLMIPHHYTRYLGDLSGGQVLKRVAKKTYDLPENGDGVKFYEFDLIPDAKVFKDAYRNKLDSIDVGREVADELVEEAKKAFMLNIGLFKELDEVSGFTEEIQHEKVTADTKKQETAERVEEVPKPSIVTKSNQNEEEKDAVNWIWIVAVAALLFAIIMGFLTKVVT